MRFWYRRRILWLGLSVLFLSSRSQTNNPIIEAKRAIEAASNLYYQAFVRGDSSVLIHLYTEDCWIMAPNNDVYCGATASLEYFRTAYIQSGIRDGRLLTIDQFGAGGEFVTALGFWQSFDGKNQRLDQGSFMILWKKSGTEWKIFRHSFGSDGNGPKLISLQQNKK